MHGERLALEHRAVDGFFLGDLRIMAEQHLARIGLGIDVDEENLFAFSGQSGRERDACRGFASTAFLAGD
jgi:hypothetical protein